MYQSEFKEQIVKEIEEVGNISLVCKRHNLKPSTVHGCLHVNKNKDKTGYGYTKFKSTDQIRNDHLKGLKALSSFFLSGSLTQ